MEALKIDPVAKPRIWTIGGGKGGVGKSVVASSLAIALARSGFRCVLMDFDFGAANLHTLLGIPEPRMLLRHFLTGEAASLEEIAVETSIPKLRLVSGARAPIDGANPGHPRRQKLLRHLRKIDADEVIVDVGAGSGLNALDFFVAADLKLVVVTPEATAIENAYHFVKAAWFRALQPAAAQPYVKQALLQVLGSPSQRQGLVPRALLEAVDRIDTSAAEQLNQRADAFRPALVVNRASSSAERILADHISDGCREAIGAKVRAVGSLSQDPSVGRALELGQPVLERFPDSHFADDVYALAERILTPGSELRDYRRPSAFGSVQRALGLDRRAHEKQQQVWRMAEIAITD